MRTEIDRRIISAGTMLLFNSNSSSNHLPPKVALAILTYRDSING
jgi:hypothetical protein